MCREMLLQVFGNARYVKYLFTLMTVIGSVDVLRVPEENWGVQRPLNAIMNAK